MTAQEGTAQEGTAQEGTADDGIPEYEPLTPELVEEEAIRGDVVLRWSVVLLAFAAGSAKIAETATLVHVKTGQYLAAHGFWPWINDPFSYTASDQSWMNLAWGFDLVLALAHAVGAFAGVGVVTALVAAVIFFLLVRISRPGIPSWWGAVCGALALLACHKQLIAEPRLITLLGLAITFRLLHDLGRREGLVNTERQPVPSDLALIDDGPGKPWPLWCLLPLFLVWSNFDPYAFLGLFLVLLYAAGESLGSRVGGAALCDSGRRSLWMMAGGAVVAGLCNPFGWRIWLEPFRQYGTVLPAIRAYMGDLRGAELKHASLADPAFWSNLDASRIAALFLIATAAATFVMNWRRMELGQFFVFLGFAGLGVFHTHELGPLAVVCAVLANLNGQAWYAENVSQDYTIETRELIFSRGGRAITVLAFAAFALYLITGRLGAGGESSQRTGYGLDAELQNTVASFSSQLEESLDHRPFNFTHAQGDVLIWIGEQVFLDSRLDLYAGGQDTSLLMQHRHVRNALRKPRQGGNAEENRRNWSEAFNRYGVTHILPRLTGRVPDYVTLFDLLDNPDFRLTSLGAATAVFYRADKGSPESVAYVADHALDFENEAFRKTVPAPGMRNTWVTPPSFYDKYLWSSRHEIPNDIQEALHLGRLASAYVFQNEKSDDLRTALAYLAIRKAQSGLVVAPNSPDGYYALGMAYSLLVYHDAGAVLTHMANLRSNLRYLQAVAAYSQCLVAKPGNPVAHGGLFQLYQYAGRIDLALREARAYEQAIDESGQEGEVDSAERRENLAKTIEQMEMVIGRIEQEMQNIIKGQAGSEQFQVQFLARRGCVLKALEGFDNYPELLAGNPDVSLLRAVLLLESGKIEEAFQEIGTLQEPANGSGSMNWAEPSAIAQLANGDSGEAANSLLDLADRLRRASGLQLSLSVPPSARESEVDSWPLSLTKSAYDHLYGTAHDIAELRLAAAMVQVEGGQHEQAVANLTAVLELEPASTARPLVAWYVQELTGDEIDPTPPHERLPIDLAPEDAADDAPVEDFTVEDADPPREEKEESKE